MKTIAVAVALLLAFAGGATAKGAYDAKNAKKVDGIQAVKASTPLAKRRGKLVATSPRTGLLPGNIIGTAPNAKKLGGVSLSQLSEQSIPVFAGHPGASGAATFSSFGAQYAADMDGSVAYETTLPSTHKATTPVRLRVLYTASQGCVWVPSVTSLTGTVGGVAQPVVDFDLPGSTSTTGTITVPNDAVTISATFTAEHPISGGSFIDVAVDRLGSQAADTCTVLTVVGVTLLY